MKRNQNTKTEAKDALLYAPKGHLFCLIADGKISTQIPHPVSEEQIKDDWEPFPARWVALLRDNYGRPALGKEGGYNFWTEIGWRENLDKIKEIWNSVPEDKRKGTLDELLQQAAEEFVARKKAAIKYKLELKAKIKQLEETEF